MDLFPRLSKVAGFLLDHLPTYLPREPLASHGDHLFERPEPVVLPEALYSE